MKVTGKVLGPHLIYTAAKKKKKKTPSFGKQKASGTTSKIHSLFPDFISLSHFTAQSSWMKGRQVFFRKDSVFIFHKKNNSSSLFASHTTYISSVAQRKFQLICMLNNCNSISFFSYWNMSSSILGFILAPKHTQLWSLRKPRSSCIHFF